jgi:hypothetical protein
MKAPIRLFLFGASVILFGDMAVNHALAADPLIGKWQNQLEKPSTLTIQTIDAATGMLHGQYHEGSTGADEPVIGWVNDAPPGTGDNVRVLSFTVRWSKFGSVTGWTGYLRNDPKTSVPTLYMQWNLARCNSQFDWDHILANQDRFTHK